MGGKKQTVGYWYRLLMDFGLCRGPVDAFLAFRGGDRDAWTGELANSGTISIDAENLWGGDRSEGGISGEVDVAFGESDQEPSSYLASNLGPQQSAHRGKMRVTFKGGRYGAMNPYPKQPAFKTRRVLQGWEGDEGAWYPEKAAVLLNAGNVVLQLGPTSSGWSYKVVDSDDAADYSGIEADDASWPTGTSPFASSDDHPYAAAGGFPTERGTTWPLNTKIWVRKTFSMFRPLPLDVTIFVDNFATVWINGHQVLPRSGTGPGPAGPDVFKHTFTVPADILQSGDNVIALLGEDQGEYSYAAFDLTVASSAQLIGMNPAHILYQSITDSWMDGEPSAAINDASFRTAADRLYAEGFGLCTEWLPSQETVLAFQQRICNVISGALNRSPVDGQWYLDLVRGDYDIDTLPVITDDDILDFAEQPSTQDSAVNQVIVEWFDPEQKEKRSTSPLQALGAIQAFASIISETRSYPEIPFEALALRAGQRDLRAKASPLRKFDLKTTRAAYALRPMGQFRLQAPKRGIADMVCLAGDIDRGSLRSGAIQLSAVQDVFSMPYAVYVQPEPGVDTSPPTTPRVITLQRAMEVPYVELVATLSPGDLQVLAPDASYVGAVASDPAGELNFSLFTTAGGDYADRGVGDWCPTSQAIDDCAPTETAVALSGARRLDEVAVGSAVLWDEEICRVDALDLGTNALVLGRGCADTVPAPHAAGSRLWFYDADLAGDRTEYVAGEAVQVKLLPNTGSQRLPLALATAMSVEVEGRQAKPYPPGRLVINGEAYPGIVSGLLEVAWAHRHRVLQADQLVDSTASSIGPEAGTTYTLRIFSDDEATPSYEQAGITAETASYALAIDGQTRVEVWAVRDGLESWQALTHTFAYSATPLAAYSDEADNIYTDENGDTYVG